MSSMTGAMWQLLTCIIEYCTDELGNCVRYFGDLGKESNPGVFTVTCYHKQNERNRFIDIVD